MCRPNEDPLEVHSVEKILKDIIDVSLVEVKLVSSMGSRIMLKKSYCLLMLRENWSIALREQRKRRGRRVRIRGRMRKMRRMMG